MLKTKWVVHMVDEWAFVCAEMVGIRVDMEKRFVDLTRSFVCICLSTIFRNPNFIGSMLVVISISVTHKCKCMMLTMAKQIMNSINDQLRSIDCVSYNTL
jgi:hypothetical protein